MSETYEHIPAIAFDTETHPLAMGNVIPKMVCMSVAFKNNGKVETDVACVADPEKTNEFISTVLSGLHRAVAHNTAFDLAVLSRQRPDLLPQIFEGLTKCVFEDTLIRETLLHLANHGNLDYCDKDGAAYRIEYGLEALSKRYLGRDRHDDKLASDSWRTHYDELEALPISKWPPAAVLYVSQDSEDCLLIRECQEIERKRLWDRTGIDPFATQDFQVCVSFALYLMSAWGFRVDPEAKAGIEAMLKEELKPENMKLLLQAGILRPAVPPRHYKTASKVKCSCVGGMVGDHICSKCDGKSVIQKMTAGEKESVDTKKLKDFIVAWATGAGIELRRTAASAKFPDGQISTDIDFFEEHRHENALFEEYYHRQKLQKLVTTEMPRMNVPGTEETAAVVHPCFKVLVTTGRTSSFASKLYPSFNCQNVDPRVRGCFVPRPGHLLFSIDYSGMELGTLAQKVYNLFGKSVHRDKINANIDNHTYLGAQLAYALDKPFRAACEGKVSNADDIYEVFVACKDHKDEKVRALFKHYRKFAKPTGLGYPGGLGPKTFIAYAKGTYGISVDLETATALREIWFETYPEMRDYFKWVNSNCVDQFNAPRVNEDTGKSQDRYAYTTPFGMLISGQSYTSVANGAGLQAFSAEGAKLSVFNLIRACYDASQYSILYGRMKPMAFIHDENLGEVPEATIDGIGPHDLCAEASRIMVNAMRVVTPDVEARAQACLMRRWQKEAEPVFDKNGRLTVWEPKKN